MHRVIDYTHCFEEVYSTENKYARAMVVNFVRVVIIAVWAWWERQTKRGENPVEETAENIQAGDA